MRPRPVWGIIAMVFLSGCLGGSSQSPRGDGSDVAGTTAPRHPGATNAQANGGGPPLNGTAGPAYPPWPDVDDATIRPGVQISTDAGQCTTNFLFRTPDNGTLLLGTAAHCVNGLEWGDAVDIEGASRQGRLAYSSWLALNLTCAEDALGSGCTSGEFQNDFALVAIDPEDRGNVHPALAFFGGPTRLGDSTELALGDRVLGYGHSWLWGDLEPLHHHEGLVSDAQQGLQFYVQTVAPGVPGDSGSAIIGKDGRALGVLVTLCRFPCAGQNGVVGLKDAVDFAVTTAGFGIELVTWTQFDAGLVP